ncbi:RES family NAD+ phosphorylase [Rhodopseudomonas sp. HC1]|uniref:RES family NAD+ phosphorylase n=1 Tax=Rhodopseudomonas infernalis TaxID=2897386 RepID=UPI001EE8A5E1|nr:RES family NAD+ phosphorylase [Rhodopseudomonas infernalis]MCG6204997.1 RES family NAD+ phosphorylase [Rhodopseudomonas infernalis]
MTEWKTSSRLSRAWTRELIRKVAEEHKARDIALLDALDRLPRVAIRSRVWRTVRAERDPLEGGSSRGRWGHEQMETLYSSFEEDGSIAEIFSLLSSQPVFPSKLRWLAYELQAELEDVLSLSTLPELAALGVDTTRYTAREYRRTQEIADAALFLGFKGLVVPSARWDCSNLVTFTEKTDPDNLTLVSAPKAIDWTEWRALRAARTR